jgi:hypothetical protein
MSLEATLEKIAESLATVARNCENLTPLLVKTLSGEAAEPEKPKRGRKSKPEPEPKPEPKPEPAAAAPADDEPEVTADDVREALRLFMKDNEPAAAKAILEKHGAPSVTALAPEKFPAVIAEFTLA